MLGEITIMQAIKTELESRLTYVRDGDIFYAEDLGIIPDYVRFPCVGIKDGGQQNRRELAGRKISFDQVVDLLCYVQLLKPEATIIGDGTYKGILEVALDVDYILDENRLQIAGVRRCFCPDVAASNPIPLEQQNQRLAVQAKVLTHYYRVECARASILAPADDRLPSETLWPRDNWVSGQPT